MQTCVSKPRGADNAAMVADQPGEKEEPRVVGTRGSKMSAWLRGKDSNLRPSGYEPDELPLLHPAKAFYCTRNQADGQSSGRDDRYSPR